MYLFKVHFNFNKHKLPYRYICTECLMFWNDWVLYTLNILHHIRWVSILSSVTLSIFFVSYWSLFHIFYKYQRMLKKQVRGEYYIPTLCPLPPGGVCYWYQTAEKFWEHACMMSGVFIFWNKLKPLTYKCLHSKLSITDPIIYWTGMCVNCLW